jgi:hypothetical protein
LERKLAPFVEQARAKAKVKAKAILAVRVVARATAGATARATARAIVGEDDKSELTDLQSFNVEAKAQPSLVRGSLALGLPAPASPVRVLLVLELLV